MMIRRFAKDRRGAIAIWFALSSPVMLGGGALAIDAASLQTIRARLQDAADSAALGTVPDLSNPATARAMAREIAARNVPANWGVVTRDADVQFGKYDVGTKTFTETVNEIDAVKVTAARDAEHGNEASLFLAKIFGRSTAPVRAYAIATGKGGSGACVIALDDKNTASGFVVSGKGKVKVPGCGIHANSRHSRSFNQSGSGGVEAASIEASGGVDYSNALPTPVPNRPKMEDPLIGLREPNPPAGCTYTNKTFSGPVTLPSNSTYCGKIAFESGVDFAPGLHYFVGASATTGPKTALRGQNVMLYFDKTSTLTSNSTGIFNLTAPQSGEYSGIAIFASRAAKATEFKLTGSSQYNVDGTIYAPASLLSLSGSAEIGAEAVNGYVISLRFGYSGDSDFIFTTQGGASPNVLSPGRIALVQ